MIVVISGFILLVTTQMPIHTENPKKINHHGTVYANIKRKFHFVVLKMNLCRNLVFSSLCCCHTHRNHFFRLYQQNKTSESKVRFRQASNHCKRLLEAAKLAYATKTKESITSQKLGSRDFWQIANSVLNKGKSATSPLFNGPEVLSSPSDKAKLFAKNFS